MPNTSLADFIGDVHGQADKLEALLNAIGYSLREGAYRHPERQAIFVGDLIDRGPGQLRTLELVRNMVEAVSAQVVMGNHELNAIAFATKALDSEDTHLRARHGDKGKKNYNQHKAFLAEIELDSDTHRSWIDWFMDLPLWIETDSYQVIHACWHTDHIDFLKPQLREGSRLSLDVLHEGHRHGSRSHQALEVLLKGLEISLPEGVSFTDKDGHVRSEIRTRWWVPSLKTYREAYIGPEGVDIPDLALAEVATVPPLTKPTFIGHYWFNPNWPLQPASKHVACVDFSAARGGPMVAYRFDGETELKADKFVAV